MKLSIIGLGAVGIMYAEILSKGLGPEDLRIIADRDRISRYRREGVFCNGKKCDFRYTPPEEAVEPADILLFTTKSGAGSGVSKRTCGAGYHYIICCQWDYQ